MDDASFEIPPVDLSLGDTRPVGGDQGALTLSNEHKHPDPNQVRQLKEWSQSPNIALIGRGDDDDPQVLADEDLSRLGMLVVRGYQIDKDSRSEWEERTRQALDLAMQVAQTKQYPWPKSSNVLFPIMTTSAISFAARAYPAIVMGRDVVKGTVIGPDDGVPAVQPPQVGGLPQMGGQLQGGAPQPGVPPQPGQAGPPPGPQAGPPPGPPQTQQQWAIGEDGTVQSPGAKQARADRIGEHMSYQLLDEQEEWEPEMDTLLVVLPIVGCDFKKTYFDSAEKRNASQRVSAMNLVINYKAKSLERAPRVTEEIEYYPLEIKQMERAGVFREITYTSTMGQTSDDDAPVKFLEQHRWCDLDDDGMSEPYVVTVEKQSQQVVRIVARFDMDGVKWNYTRGHIQRVEPIHFYTKYDFLPNPDGGIYGMGFAQLLKPINESINTTLNMLIDAGHLANVQGGFIGKGLSMSSGSLRFQPGEWKPVNSAGGTIRDNLVPLTFTGPNATLFQLLGLLVEAAKDIAGVKDVLTGESLPANTPATTMLAMIEQGLKTYTAIYKRVHRSLKQELAKLYRLNRVYLDQEASYKVGNTWKSITRVDYEKGSGVEPVSDPTVVTDMQRLGQAQLLFGMKDDPLLLGVEIRKRYFKAANIPNPDALINPNPPPNAAIVSKMLELQMTERDKAASLQLRERHDAALIESERARALLYRAQSIQAVANAAKLVGSHDLAWAEHELDGIKTLIDMQADSDLAGTSAATIPGGPPPPSGAPPVGQGPAPGIPGQMAPPMTGGGGPMVPQPGVPPVVSRLAGIPTEAPPLAGARKAPDGKWYVRHPSGVHMRVDKAA